jgi:hypothetical protein
MIIIVKFYEVGDTSFWSGRALREAIVFQIHFTTNGRLSENI